MTCDHGGQHVGPEHRHITTERGYTERGCTLRSERAKDHIHGGGRYTEELLTWLRRIGT